MAILKAMLIEPTIFGTVSLIFVNVLCPAVIDLLVNMLMNEKTFLKNSQFYKNVRFFYFLPS